MLDISRVLVRAAMSVSVLSITAGCGAPHRVLELKDVQFLKVQEEPAGSPRALRVSGLAFHSALAVDGIHVLENGDVRIVEIPLVAARPGLSGSFEYVVEVPASVQEVQFGRKHAILWRRSKN
jgi:hypothetical protein